MIARLSRSLAAALLFALPLAAPAPSAAAPVPGQMCPMAGGCWTIPGCEPMITIRCIIGSLSLTLPPLVAATQSGEVVALIDRL